LHASIVVSSLQHSGKPLPALGYNEVKAKSLTNMSSNSLLWVVDSQHFRDLVYGSGTNTLHFSWWVEAVMHLTHHHSLGEI